MATADEIRIAHEIMKAARRLQLPLKLDEITEGRGNCFPLSVLAQCRRQEIFKDLRSSIRSLIQHGDPTLLRREVYKFMTNSRHQTIQEYKRRYQEIVATLDNKTWREYWAVMLRNYEWVDSIFIQSTAWLLGHDIIIVTTTSTEDHPYITISGNLVDENIPCQGIPLTIGSKSNVHFQSLIPLEVRVPRNSIKPRSPEDTINMKVKTTSSQQNEFPQPDLDSREDFPELKPSRNNQKVQPRTLTRSQDMEKTIRHTKATDVTIKKELYVKNQITEKPIQNNENKVFKYEQQGNVLNFQFVSDKRVKCPTCRNDFKNILCHIQRSGCGIATYYNHEKVRPVEEVKTDKFQIGKFKHKSLDIINVYRSQSGHSLELLEHLKKQIEAERITIITGDFNICFMENNSNRMIQGLLSLGFDQLVHEPTHIQGRHIDHVYFLDPSKRLKPIIDRYSPYYSDHDGICITIPDVNEIEKNSVI
jgi:hypothetical protein